jgi:hypothetical protein
VQDDEAVFGDSSSDDEEESSVEDDDYYERPNTLRRAKKPSSKLRRPKPTFAHPTAATTTAAFRLKAEVALKAVGSKTKNAAKKVLATAITTVWSTECTLSTETNHHSNERVRDKMMRTITTMIPTLRQSRDSTTYAMNSE